MKKQLKAAIIDDEPSACNVLRRMLSQYSEIQITGEANNIKEAKNLISQKNIDVVFLDIMLTDGSGFDIIPFIHKAAEIIFMTGHDSYAVQAFEVNALDYLLKPFTVDRLSASLKRLKNKIGLHDDEDHIFINEGDKHYYISTKTIAFVESIGGNYTAAYLDDGNRIVMRKTLKTWRHMLPDTQFFHAHRSSIVNLKQIEHVQKNTVGPWTLYLKGAPKPVNVGCRSVPKLKNLLTPHKKS